MLKLTFNVAFCISMLGLTAYCKADSLEVQSNPVPDGAIQVADGDPDRSDWEGIPWFEEDEDFDEFFPVDIFRVQVAHDNQNVYFHLETSAWEVDEAWRVGTYLDTDQDDTTGYNGNFMAVGADYLVEAAATYEFTAGSQAEWGWAQTAELARDQSSIVDVEVAVPRFEIGNPSEFDFALFANNFCCDFQLPDDIYPNEASGLGGFFFSYELGEAVLAGDFDRNGSLELLDVNALSEQIAMTTHDPAFDLNSDSLVDSTDLTIWIHDLKTTWFGDANLSDEFDSSDLVSVFQAGKFERDVAAKWEEGDWTGDLRFESGDFVRAFQDGGYEQGPMMARGVPEPSTAFLVLLGISCLGYDRRKLSQEERILLRRTLRQSGRRNTW